MVGEVYKVGHLETFVDRDGILRLSLNHYSRRVLRTIIIGKRSRINRPTGVIARARQTARKGWKFQLPLCGSKRNRAGRTMNEQRSTWGLLVPDDYFERRELARMGTFFVPTEEKSLYGDESNKKRRVT